MLRTISLLTCGGAVIYNEGCLNRGEIPKAMYAVPIIVGIFEDKVKEHRNDENSHLWYELKGEVNALTRRFKDNSISFN